MYFIRLVHTVFKYINTHKHRQSYNIQIILELHKRGGVIEAGFIQKQRQRSSPLFGRQKWSNSLPHHRMIGRNGWIEKWPLGGMNSSEQLDDLPTQTTQNHHPPKMDVLSKTFLHIILAATNSSTVHPPSSSDDLCLLFCMNPSSMGGVLCVTYV